MCIMLPSALVASELTLPPVFTHPRAFHPHLRDAKGMAALKHHLSGEASQPLRLCAVLNGSSPSPWLFASILGRVFQPCYRFLSFRGLPFICLTAFVCATAFQCLPTQLTVFPTAALGFPSHLFIFILVRHQCPRCQRTSSFHLAESGRIELP